MIVNSWNILPDEITNSESVQKQIWQIHGSYQFKNEFDKLMGSTMYSYETKI